MRHGSICQDEHCTIIEVHAIHAVPAVRPHHRPKPMKCTLCPWKGPASLERNACPRCKSAITGTRAPWEYDDPMGLTGAVARATSKSYPMTFAMICRDVRDDYGECTERTIHRHLARLVDRGCILKVDIAQAFAVYLRPGSKLANDIETLREFDYFGGHNTLESHPWKRSNPRGTQSLRLQAVSLDA